MKDGWEIPDEFARHAAEAFGSGGEAWLGNLPGLLAELSARWEFRVGRPFELSYSYVAPVVRADGTSAVIKVGVPDDEALGEIAALRLYHGQGACQLLEADEEERAMLLERLQPGDTLVGLAQLDDEAATRVGAAAMRRLWRPVAGGNQLKSIAQWFEDAFARHRAEYGGPGPLPPELFVRAEQLARDLLASAPTEVMLHGDLHHFNILSAEREPWLVIDPKGMRGDPGYEVGPFLVNPVGQNPGRTPALLERRLAVFAEELRYDRARLREWGIAHGMLSAMWSAENGGGNWRGAIQAAEMLSGL